jgi:hypothetical protein
MAKDEEALPLVPPPNVEAPPRKLITEEPPSGTQYFHTDYATIHWSVFDLKIRFGELVKFDAATNTSTVWEKAVASMAWGHAKVLAGQLADAVSRYEKANGPIKSLSDLNLP